MVVRYSKWSLLFLIVPSLALFLIGKFMMLVQVGFFAVMLWLLIPVLVVPGLGRLLDRRPLMTIAPDGVTLHVAGGVFLTYDQIDVWTEKHSDDGQPWMSFSVQARPRLHLEVGLWARVNKIRADTFLDGDICFNDTSLDCSAADIAAAVERYAARCAGGGHRPIKNARIANDPGIKFYAILR